jgi:hypothetical protein
MKKKTREKDLHPYYSPSLPSFALASIAVALKDDLGPALALGERGDRLGPKQLEGPIFSKTIIAMKFYCIVFKNTISIFANKIMYPEFHLDESLSISFIIFLSCHQICLYGELFNEDKTEIKSPLGKA